jgi:hypothetical protein
MHNDDTAIDAWLGDATLTTEQRDRFITIWDDVATRHPEPEDQDVRSAALSAAVQHLLGETTPTDEAMGGDVMDDEDAIATLGFDDDQAAHIREIAGL